MTGETAIAQQHTTRASPSDGLRERVMHVLRGFESWLGAFGEVSQDQYDFWACRLGKTAKRVYYARPHLAMPLIAPFVLADALAPGLRRFVRRPQRFPIADAHYAMAFFALGEAEDDDSALARACHFLRQLEESRCPQFGDFCWGYPFDWETCFGRFEAGRPLITTIPYCYEAFEDGYRLTADERYLDIMESIARFCFEQIPSTSLEPGSAAAAYSSSDVRRVVNASSYRAFLLTTAGLRFEREDWLAAASENLGFVLRSQRDDGSWVYAMDGNDAFVDNFHTCLVLKNLFKIWERSGVEAVGEAIHAGYDFYRNHLLGAGFQPVPFALPQRFVAHKDDLYDYAEGINLAWLLREVHPSAPRVLRELLEGLLEKWVLSDGHFVTRHLLLGRRNTVPYHRWAQSQTFRALALYYRGT